MKNLKKLEVDLENQVTRTSSSSSGKFIHFDIEPHKKKILLEGLDDIAHNFSMKTKFQKFEKNSKIPSVLESS